jgi:hypothetical protein
MDVEQNSPRSLLPRNVRHVGSRAAAHDCIVRTVRIRWLTIAGESGKTNRKARHSDILPSNLYDAATKTTQFHANHVSVSTFAGDYFQVMFESVHAARCPPLLVEAVLINDRRTLN